MFDALGETLQKAVSGAMPELNEKLDAYVRQILDISCRLQAIETTLSEINDRLSDLQLRN